MSQYELVYEVVINLIKRMVNDAQDIQRKWIVLTILKSNLRNILNNYQRFLSHLPDKERGDVLEKFERLKDFLWQAIGAVHGNLVSMCGIEEVCIQIHGFFSTLCTLANEEFNAKICVEKKRFYAMFFIL